MKTTKSRELTTKVMGALAALALLGCFPDPNALLPPPPLTAATVSGGATVGTGSGGGAGGSTPLPTVIDPSTSCQPGLGDNACVACARAMCCQQFTACTTAPTCSQLASCLAACPAGDDACTQRCTDQFPTGLAPLLDFGGCLQGRCAAPCK